jgi:hypothetical protein
MNRHRLFERLLAHRDDLGSVNRSRLEKHLRSCSECREVAAQYAEDEAALRFLAQTRPPTGLRTAVLAAVDRKESRVSPRRTKKPAVFGATGTLVTCAVLLATVLARQGAQPTPRTGLMAKGYTFSYSYHGATVDRTSAERVALAFFPGHVQSAVLARVRNSRTPGLGSHGRVCWVVSIVPPQGTAVAQPGNTWLDIASASPGDVLRIQFLVVFIDATQGNFVVASSTESA